MLEFVMVTERPSKRTSASVLPDGKFEKVAVTACVAEFTVII
jgi:hypothetical protein